jgi:hypothetical protein
MAFARTGTPEAQLQTFQLEKKEDTKTKQAENQTDKDKDKK